MDLALDETQQMLRNSARDFLSRECQPEVVRAMERDERGYSTELWDQMITLGWTGLPFPEEHGGTAASFLDLAALLEEMGRALAPVPFFSTVVLGGLTVMEAGNDDQRHQIIPDICRGQALMTLAVLEESASYTAGGIQSASPRAGRRLRPQWHQDVRARRAGSRPDDSGSPYLRPYIRRRQP